MITATVTPLMDDHEVAVLEVFIWFALIFFTTLAVVWFIRRFILDGDVVKEANQVLDETQTIESYLADWAPGLTTRTAIAETRSLDQDRA